MNIKNLLRLTESDYLDFKRQWHSNNADLIHDILCLCNSLSENKERFIIIGIKEDSKTKLKIFYCVKKDKNKKTEADIVNLLRGININYFPKIEVLEHYVKGKYIDCIKITPFLEHLPYVLTKEYSNGIKIIRNAIYSRDGSCNTPKTESANIDKIKKMFLMQRGEQYTPQEKFETWINEIDSWEKDQSGVIYCKKDLDLRVKKVNIDDNNVRYFNKTADIPDYLSVLRDIFISEKFWKARKEVLQNSIEEHYSWFNACVFYKDIQIYNFHVLNVFLKGMPITALHTIHSFYFPDSYLINNVDYKSTKENFIMTMKKTLNYKICELLYNLDSRNCHVKYSNDIYFKWLNYNFIKDVTGYLKKHQKLLYAKR
ncbi:MAG: putative DNA binding domain-containing protein [Endomicrobiaceae bacterium]|nr:putative DNA binding domain-containing protein [Endomicrobiaceae bacterium]